MIPAATSIARPRPSLLHVAVLALTGSGPEGSTRRRVYAFVSQFPGLHQREIARRLDLRPSLAEHHLRHLTRAGLVSAERTGQFVRYYVRVSVPEPISGAVGTNQRRVLSLLRQPRILELVAHLITKGPATMGNLARALHVSPATATHHVKRLEKEDIVSRRIEGREHIVTLVDRSATVAMLLAYEPPADLVAGFQDLWDDVGF